MLAGKAARGGWDPLAFASYSERHGGFSLGVGLSGLLSPPFGNECGSLTEQRCVRRLVLLLPVVIRSDKQERLSVHSTRKHYLNSRIWLILLLFTV